MGDLAHSAIQKATTTENEVKRLRLEAFDKTYVPCSTLSGFVLKVLGLHKCYEAMCVEHTLTSQRSPNHSTMPSLPSA
ncbi:unnamed protein product [Fusarium graminearum]|nr:unnamed protein product [Fusarium graminearum]